MDLYEKLSAERKELQAQGLIPEWYSTAGWQMFKERYLSDTDRAVRGQFERIAATAARHLRHIGKEEEAREKFFQMLWDGWLSPSTPVLSNMGTNKGMPISCSGTYVGDEITEFFGVRHETAMLTKNGFGTAAYLGDIRPRGSKISRGGKASGVLPVFKGFVQDSRDVSQGTRRGAWAGYLPIDHGDFDELADFVMAEVDDCNVGWNVSAAFIEKLDAGDPEAVRRYQKAMKMKMVTGRGYFFFPDKANAKRPPMYVERGLDIKSPQLCNEIMLHSSKDYTYTCVLSNMNLVHYDTWKNTDAVFWATVFLDCVISEFLEKAEHEPMLHKAVAFTRAGRALGLGVCGFHTYLQNSRLAYEGLEAHFKNIEIFKHLFEESKRASVWMAQELGEPEWCVGHGVRNTHNIALPPTKSCMPGDTVIQTAAGNMSYFQILESQGVNTDKLTSIDVELEDGSVVSLKYNQMVKVLRDGVEQDVYAAHLREDDELLSK